MGLSEKLLFFFSSLGAFNGLVLSIYFFFFSAKKQLSTVLLGALLFVLSARIGKSVAYFFDYSLPKIYLQLGLTACFFIGPFLCFYIRSEIGQVRKLPRSWAWQLVGWSVVIGLTGILYPYQSFPRLWGKTIIPLIYTQWGIYVVVAVISLIPVIKKIARKETVKPYEKWVLSICAGVLMLWSSYVYSILGITKGSYIFGALIFSSIIYVVIFILLYRKKTSDLTSLSVPKYADKKLGEDDARLIVAKLTRVMSEKAPFRNPGLKINDLAREINISSHQLSQVLNSNFQKNFTLFVNEYRIDEACKILTTDTNLTIDAIGAEVGFNSKSTFFATFKKIKGVTPSVYQQENTPEL